MKTPFSLWSLLSLIALVLPTAYLVYCWDALPAQIPTHFDANGQANGFTAKESMWWLCLALPLGMYALLHFLPRFDPKKQLSGTSVNYQKLQFLLVAMLSGVSLYSLYVAQHAGTPPGSGLAVILGLFFALLGNYLTTVPQNYFVGIRTPWALESTIIWARTHRLGGYLFFGVGLLSAGLAFWSAPVATTVLVAGVLGTVVATYVYSYYLYRQMLNAA
ncbi:SdpI family protein [Hymenobacter guriensis]|uniref:SdpI family protein n=1 Tax=Hymenobacter guriensis TaxID=2793065 RepID=A0ABS0L2B7_9BACT|nr:SdpI family protein [Hymenobacter guriensis]MBG8554223.1 SdpI family protein [Hymenobacter guriensis]